MGSSKERHVLWGGAPSLFGLQGAFLHTCSQEDTLKNEEYVVFYLLSGQDSAPLSLLLFWDICPEEKFQLLNLGPISLLPQNDHTTHGCHSLAGNLCSWPCCNLFWLMALGPGSPAPLIPVSGPCPQWLQKQQWSHVHDLCSWSLHLLCSSAFHPHLINLRRPGHVANCFHFRTSAPLSLFHLSLPLMITKSAL